MISLIRKEHKHNTISRILKISSIACFIVAAILIVIMILLQIDSIRVKYDEYLYFLEDFENKVAALKSRWLILIVIFLLFLLRSLSMIYPYSIIYIITAMVFPPLESFLINLSGMAFTFSFRYYTGVEMGEGTINNVLKKYPYIMSSIEAGGKGNAIVVLALRMIPGVPINTISHLYGSIDYPFMRYLFLSAAAYVPRLISYSFVGNNVYDPFSAKFFIPLITLLIFTGICLIIFRWTLNIKYRFLQKPNRKENV